MNDDGITVFARKGENFIGYEKAPGHGGTCCVDEGKDAWHKRFYTKKVPGIEIFGGYLPVYHDRKGLTKIAGDCMNKKSLCD